MTRHSRLGAVSASGLWATFYLEDEMLAVPVEDVQEVMMQQPLTPVPLAPTHVVGLLNLRGQVMPAIDLRKRLNFSARVGEKEASLLVLKSEGHLFSVVVDDIGDVLELLPDRWQSPPDTLAAEHRRFVLGICPIEHHVVLGLRVEALSGDDDRSNQGG